jgi:glucose-6-phosphate 1-epimerase
MSENVIKEREFLDNVVLTSIDGARAEFVKQGAHLCSWVPAGGVEQLFVSQKAEFSEGAAIRGGVPVIFPQFAGLGGLPKHGFARTADWRLMQSGQTADGHAQAVFELRENSETLAIWPNLFRAELIATLSADRLQIEFSVHNTGKHSFSFSAALHSYFAVEDINETKVLGLGGLRYRDTVIGKNDCRQEDDLLEIVGEIDRIYADIVHPIYIEQDQQKLEITQTGFVDAVVWNPGEEKGASLTDLEKDGFRRMLCIEAAAIMHPIVLEPGRVWSGSQCLRYLPNKA